MTTVEADDGLRYDAYGGRISDIVRGAGLTRLAIRPDGAFVLSGPRREVVVSYEKAHQLVAFSTAGFQATGVQVRGRIEEHLTQIGGYQRREAWTARITSLLEGAVELPEDSPPLGTDRMDVERATYREPYDRSAMLARDNWTCRLCLLPIQPGDECLDHVVPIALGGADAPWNVQAAHLTCNARKGASAPAGRLIVVPSSA